ncbi:ComF family protein [Pararhodospirillum oryzae]|nr:ComF family protein [Pararhodospirillum oryzae]
MPLAPWLARRGAALASPLAALGRRGQALARAGLDFLLPPRCLACGAVVLDTGAVCPECFARLTFITEPVCARCGLPLPDPPQPGVLLCCGACLRRAPAFDQARAVLVYDDGSAPLILRLKNGDRPESVPALGRWMARAGRSLLEPGAVLVPVPLHWTRLFRRRYNQSALLAFALGRASGLEVRPRALIRVRATPPQGLRPPGGRYANVRGAFRVRVPDHVAERTIVLVDDVLTTGATTEACARVLREAGATRIVVLTLARVPLQH